MNSIKKLLVFVFIFSMAISIQFTIPSCTRDNDDDDDIGTVSVTVNEPTNDYSVVVQLIGIGSYGCGMGTVTKQDENILDAEITVNGVEFFLGEDSLIYGESSGNLSYASGTSYTLEVKRNGAVIATGNSRMPSAAEITTPASGSQFQVNDPITVKWKTVKYATSIVVSVTSDSLEDEFESGTLPPYITEYALPADLTSSPGIYSITTMAYHGIPSGMVHTDVDSGKGYNIEKAAGIFMAASMYPVDMDSENGHYITITDGVAKSVIKQQKNFISVDSARRYFLRLTEIWR